jgi:hypothetical protein
MRKFATTALTALAIGLMGSATALADSAPYKGSGYSQQQKQHDQWNQGKRGDDRRFEHRRDNRRFDNRRINFQLHFGNFDRWERGWGFGTWQNQYRFHRPLTAWQLQRQLERQGYYGVSHLQRARHGFGYRAFAFNSRGRPVMLRVNPYTGRVMDVRYI